MKYQSLLSEKKKKKKKKNQKNISKCSQSVVFFSQHVER